MHNYYMKEAIKQANKALNKNEVPVGAVIVRNNKIIAKAFNKKEKKHDCTQHAEMLVIQQASKKIKNWRLDDCTIYVTMEPCMMCCGAIQQSRIKTIVYGIKNENFGYTKEIKNIKIVPNICEKECKELIQNFFLNLR